MEKVKLIDPYPLKTQPFYRDYLWGGRKLESVLGKQLPANGVWAESWEIVDHPEHSSIISGGPLSGQSLRQIAKNQPDWLFGPRSKTRSLPLLLKYLDCQRVLSVQVHPNDNYAQQMASPDLGKTEAWYIIAAEPGAVLYAGLKPGTTREQLLSAVESGQVETCLHVIEPQAGDCVFVPAGTVHALGAGLLVAEIQQASNTTFRLFDWNRVDAHGRPRELHLSQALDVIDFDSGPRALQLPTPTAQPNRECLVNCDKFVLDRIRARDQQPASASVAGDGQLHLLTAPCGSAMLRWHADSATADQCQTELRTGESLLIPATMPEIKIELATETTLLDMVAAG